MQVNRYSSEEAEAERERVKTPSFPVNGTLLGTTSAHVMTRLLHTDC